MSKIGRKPIAFSTAKIEVNGSHVSIKGSKESFTHELPSSLVVVLTDKMLKLETTDLSRENKVLWGLHRALLMNKITGVESGFEQKMSIVGLGYKALLAGSKMTFTLGYTHKIDLDLPAGVTVEVDKTGQQMTFRSANKFLLGSVCDTVRSFRPPEPYKGTGIMKQNEVIIRKAGKTKSS